MTDKDLNIAVAIRQEGQKALKPLYQELKPAFLQYMLRYTQDPDIRLDAFHEAMIAFYEYCLVGKYDARKSAPKTMVFMMGRAYLINRLKLERRSMAQEEDALDVHVEKRILEQYQFSLNDSEVVIRAAMARMGEKCRHLLELFFYRNYGIDAIREAMNYKNENVVSSHKSRCIKQLKEILQEKV